MASILKLDTLQTPSGTGVITSPNTIVSPGAVLQTLSFPSSFIETNVSVRDTYTSAGVSAIITPISATSKILVMVNAYMLSYGATASGVVWCMTRIKRGSTIITSREFEGGQVNSSYYHHKNVNPCITILDSPNTTSQLTYTFEIMLPTTANGQTIQNTLLRTKFGPSDGVGGGNIILQEIAQ